MLEVAGMGLFIGTIEFKADFLCNYRERSKKNHSLLYQRNPAPEFKSPDSFFQLGLQEQASGMTKIGCPSD